MGAVMRQGLCWIWFEGNIQKRSSRACFAPVWSCIGTKRRARLFKIWPNTWLHELNCYILCTLRTVCKTLTGWKSHEETVGIYVAPKNNDSADRFSNSSRADGWANMAPAAAGHKSDALITIVYDDNQLCIFLPVLASVESPNDTVPRNNTTDTRKFDQQAQGDIKDTLKTSLMDLANVFQGCSWQRNRSRHWIHYIQLLPPITNCRLTREPDADHTRN